MRGHKRNLNKFIYLAIMIAIGFSCLGVMSKEEKIHSNITIENIDVGKLTKNEADLMSAAANMIHRSNGKIDSLKNLIQNNSILYPYFNKESVLNRLKNNSQNLPYGFYGITTNSNINNKYSLLDEVYKALPDTFDESYERIENQNSKESEIFKIYDSAGEIEIDNYIRKVLLQDPDITGQPQRPGDVELTYSNE